MKRTTTLLFACLVLLIGCEKKSERINAASVPDTATHALKHKEEAITRGPSKHFRTMAGLLDSLGFTSDTARVKARKNYKELIGCPVVMFGRFPFYKLDKRATKILRAGPVAIDTDIFKEATDVWGYFYRGRKSASLVEDGIIEQWTFADSATAQAALNKLTTMYPLPYFNTQPCYIINAQRIFIFHTRASAFGYGQKNLAQRFKVLLRTELAPEI